MLVVGICLCIAIGYPAPVSALEEPEEKPVLILSGNISKKNSPNGTADFDLPMLQNLPKKVIKTTTPWTDGQVTFEGVLIRDVLKAAQALGVELKASAINDYSVTIPIEDVNTYDIIIAYKKNGTLMTIRDKGPLWIIYPWSEMPELKTELHHSRSIWQLNSITVR
jgi:hypothetical protein